VHAGVVNEKWCGRQIANSGNPLICVQPWRVLTKPQITFSPAPDENKLGHEFFRAPA
jgi:hypothetical protein